MPNPDNKEKGNGVLAEESATATGAIDGGEGVSVAQRFGKLLAKHISPETYIELTLLAEQRVKTLNDCLMELAEKNLDMATFATIKREAEQREAQAQSATITKDTAMRAAPVKPDEVAKPNKAKGTHPQDRLEERFGLHLSQNDLNEMIQLIKTKAPGVKQLGSSMEIRVRYEVIWRGKRINVVYSPRAERIVTALPLEQLRKLRRHDRRNEVRGNPRSLIIPVDDDET